MPNHGMVNTQSLSFPYHIIDHKPLDNFIIKKNVDLRRNVFAWLLIVHFPTSLQWPNLWHILRHNHGMWPNLWYILLPTIICYPGMLWCKWQPLTPHWLRHCPIWLFRHGNHSLLLLFPSQHLIIHFSLPFFFTTVLQQLLQ